MLRNWVLPLAFACTIAAPALAQDQGGGGGHHGGRFRAACGQDVQTLCPDAQSREDRRACMMQNQDKLSDGCKSFLANMRMMRGGEQGAPQGQ